MSSLFSGEERYGLCLDLYTSHTQYNNLKHIKKRLQYLQYLDVLGTVQNGLHAELLNETRHGKDYEAYISSVHFLCAFDTDMSRLVIYLDSTARGR
jgi:splicing factor 3A subunit 3